MPAGRDDGRCELRGPRPTAKARIGNNRSPLMVAIGVILVFIAVMAILNRIEFGRFD
jgi:hypothetical protein